MKSLFAIVLILLQGSEIMIYRFSTSSSLDNWRIVNDGVMGGLSSSELYISKSGAGIFEGKMSTANNGGFAMVKYICNLRNVKSYTKLKITLKGDGKVYQFRIKENIRQYYSYVQNFKTTGAKQTIELELKDFKPAFRGRQLSLSNFNANTIQQLAFLIGNKKEETFRVQIFSIAIE